MKNLITLVLLFFYVNLFAQTTNQEPNSGFQAISVVGGFNVYLIPSATEKVEIKNGNEFLAHIKTEVKGNTLFIWLDKPELWYGKGEKDEIDIEVHFKNLTSISVAASADVVGGKNKIAAQKMELKAYSGSSIQTELDCKQIFCESYGGSGLYLNGKTENLEAQIHEGSLLDAYQLNTKNAILKSNTGSLIKVNVSQNLNAGTTSGFIRYQGNPSQTQFSNLWGGTIVKE